MSRNRHVARWIALGAAGALVLGTVTLAQGSSGRSGLRGQPTSTVQWAGPITLTGDQRAVLSASNVSSTARQVGMKLFDQAGKVLAQGRPTIPPGESRSIIAILIGLRAPEATRGPAAAGAVRARIAFVGGDPDRPVIVGGISVQDTPSSPTSIVDGTSNTILFGESFTQLVHSTQGDSARVMVANLGRSAASFTAIAVDAKGNSIARKSLRQIAPGAVGTANFLMGDGSVRFVVNSVGGTLYDATTQFASANLLLPYIEQDN